MPATPTATDLMAGIKEYAGLGWHRTGSLGDEATTEWLIRRLAQIGVRGVAHPFLFPQVEIARAEIQFGGATLAGHPQFDAGTTGPAGVTGPLVPPDRAAAGAIVVIDVTHDHVSIVDAIAADRALKADLARCQAAGALGAVVVRRGSAGSLAVMNAPRIAEPDPFPVLWLPPAAAGPLIAARDRGDRATLTIDLARPTTGATNAWATIPATGSAHPAPLIVMTPKSGWFTCAAERGGGIAIWLAVAEAIAGLADRPRDTILIASSGHELGHFGLEAYLHDHPTLSDRAHAWLHLGASIGAAVRPSLRLVASDADLHARTVAALERHGAGPLAIAPVGTPPVGEAANIAGRGGRFVSFAGHHAYFHTPEDRPEVVDGAALARYSAAIVDLAVGLLG